MNPLKKSHLRISQLATSDLKSAESLSASEKSELLILLNSSYPHIGEDKVFDNYPCYKQLFIFRLRINKTLVASRQFLIVDDLSKSPSWAIEMNDELQTKRFAIGSRAIVHPILRGHGFGSKLVKTVNQEIYTNYDAEAIFGYSTNMNAIALYYKHGAKIWENDIKNLHQDNSSNIPPAATEEMFKVKYNPSNRMLSPIRYVYKNNTLNNNKNEKWRPSHYPLRVNNENKILLSA